MAEVPFEEFLGVVESDILVSNNNLSWIPLAITRAGSFISSHAWLNGANVICQVFDGAEAGVWNQFRAISSNTNVIITARNVSAYALFPLSSSSVLIGNSWMAELSSKEWFWWVPRAVLISASDLIGDVHTSVNHGSIGWVPVIVSASVDGRVVWVNWLLPIAGLGIPEPLNCVRSSVISSVSIGSWSVWIWSSSRGWAVNYITVPFAEPAIWASSISGLVSTIPHSFSILTGSLIVSTCIWLEANFSLLCSRWLKASSWSMLSVWKDNIDGTGVPVDMKMNSCFAAPAFGSDETIHGLCSSI